MIEPRAWGISPGYRDNRGQWIETTEETARLFLDVMGADSPEPPPSTVLFMSPDRVPEVRDATALELEDGGVMSLRGPLPKDLPFGYHSVVFEDREPERLVVSPGRCYLPDDLKIWGWGTQLYSLRSKRSWGMGDLADLKSLGWWARNLGAQALLLNPLHAVNPGSQQDSPYFPSSRCFRNPLYLRVDDDSGHSPQLLNASPRINRTKVYGLKMAALEHRWDSDERDPRFERFRDERGELLTAFATYMALAEAHGTEWRSWPDQLRHPGAPGVLRFQRGNARRVAFHEWLQFLIEDQLAAAARTIGLIHDLAIGVDRNGADAWMWQDLFASGVTVGAPPDPFSGAGQDWGLPPFDPWKLSAAGYEPFIQIVRAALRHGTGARIDHVMGLFRLFWIPEGKPAKEGAYVAYPEQDLLDIVALESVRAGAYVIGEDLGTVEDHVREEMTRRQMLGCRVMWFEDDVPSKFPGHSLAAITNHDLPTVAGLWTGADEHEQVDLGLDPDPEAREVMLARLKRATKVTKSASVPEVIRKAYDSLGRAPSAITIATLEDAQCLELRPNLPGTSQSQRPNWSAALPRSVEDLARDELPAEIAVTLGTKRRSGVTLEEGYVDVPGGRLHTVTAGEGPPVVLLHGFPDFWYTWREQIHPLAEAGFRVIAPDMRGYNKSFKADATADYAIHLLVDDVVGLIHASGDTSAHVVGHDWGAIVAWHLAMSRPDVVKKLGILNVPHPALYRRGARDLRQVLKSWYILFFQIPFLPERAIAAQDFKGLRRLFRNACVRENAFTEEDIDRYVEAARRSHNMKGPIAYYRAYARKPVRSQEGIREIDKPVLILWGDRDPAIRVSLSEPSTRLVPDREIVHFPDAGHWVHIDEPDEVNRRLIEFLED